MLKRWSIRMKEEILYTGLRNYLVWFGYGQGMAAVISYLFYQSLLAFLFLQPFVVYLVTLQRKKNRKQRQKVARLELKEGLSSLIANLRAGYSLENAFLQTKIELQRMYSPHSVIVKEFDTIVRQQELKVPIEELLIGMANHLHMDEAIQFSNMVALGKRTGGDLIHIMSKTVENIGQIQEVEEEIDTLITGKRMEQNVMCVLPFFIIGYVSITNPHYYANMYHNLLGVLFMTVMLLLILVAKIVGDRLIGIEV